jgi:hypothetical protein
MFQTEFYYGIPIVTSIIIIIIIINITKSFVLKDVQISMVQGVSLYAFKYKHFRNNHHTEHHCKALFETT